MNAQALSHFHYKMHSLHITKDLLSPSNRNICIRPVAPNPVEIMSTDIAEMVCKVHGLYTAKSADTAQIKIGNRQIGEKPDFSSKSFPFSFYLIRVCLLVKRACKMSGDAKFAEIAISA